MTPAEVCNRTRNTVLHSNPEWALTFWQRMRGFMGTNPGKRAKIFLFMPPRKVSMHMFFVFGPIDAIALDGQGKAIAIKENFHPWTLWTAQVTASAIVELPAGTVKATKTQLGDSIALPAVTIRG